MAKLSIYLLQILTFYITKPRQKIIAYIDILAWTGDD